MAKDYLVVPASSTDPEQVFLPPDYLVRTATIAFITTILKPFNCFVLRTCQDSPLKTRWLGRECDFLTFIPKLNIDLNTWMQSDWFSSRFTVEVEPNQLKRPPNWTEPSILISRWYAERHHTVLYWPLLRTIVIFTTFVLGPLRWRAELLYSQPLFWDHWGDVLNCYIHNLCFGIVEAFAIMIPLWDPIFHCG